MKLQQRFKFHRECLSARKISRNLFKPQLFKALETSFEPILPQAAQKAPVLGHFGHFFHTVNFLRVLFRDTLLIKKSRRQKILLAPGGN